MKFSVHVPGWQFAETWEGESVEDIKKQYRERYGRLPKGFCAWEYKPLPGMDDPYSAMRYMM